MPLESVLDLPADRPVIKAALFDFDGTISTLRHGWERIMAPMMLRTIAAGGPVSADLRREIKAYVEESTGIQTIYQMQWLAEAVRRHGSPKPKDPWEYKDEYNAMILELVNERIHRVEQGISSKDDFLIKGSVRFLAGLRRRGATLYAASGTDHPDVVREATFLGVGGCFAQIAGAPVGRASCSKEAVLRDLFERQGLRGPEVAVFGDGKVEISLAREAGAIAVGVASDEERLCGVNEVKRKRLIEAGAHAIVGDFGRPDEIFDYLYTAE